MPSAISLLCFKTTLIAWTEAKIAPGSTPVTTAVTNAKAMMTLAHTFRPLFPEGGVFLEDTSDKCIAKISRLFVQKTD
jgi:hypothetical protein